MPRKFRPLLYVGVRATSRCGALRPKNRRCPQLKVRKLTSKYFALCGGTIQFYVIGSSTFMKMKITWLGTSGVIQNWELSTVFEATAEKLADLLSKH